MGFWKQREAAPIQSHHFRVDFNYAQSAKPMSFTVKSCTLPSAEVSTGEYQVGNQIFKYPGVHKWGDVTITFVDDKNTTRRLVHMFAEQGWVNPPGGNSLEENRMITTSIVGESSNLDPDNDPNSPLNSDIQAIQDNPETTLASDRLAGEAFGEVEGPASGLGARMFSANPSEENMFRALYVPLDLRDGHKKDRVNTIDIIQMGKPAAFVMLDGPAGPNVFGNEITEADIPKVFGVPIIDVNMTQAQFGMITKDVPLQQWKLENPFIKSINFGTHDYSSDELITIEVTFGFDFASCIDRTTTLDPFFK